MDALRRDLKAFTNSPHLLVSKKSLVRLFSSREEAISLLASRDRDSGWSSLRGWETGAASAFLTLLLRIAEKNKTCTSVIAEVLIRSAVQIQVPLEEEEIYEEEGWYTRIETLLSTLCKVHRHLHEGEVPQYTKRILEVLEAQFSRIAENCLSPQIIAQQILLTLHLIKILPCHSYNQGKKINQINQIKEGLFVPLLFKMMVRSSDLPAVAFRRSSDYTGSTEALVNASAQRRSLKLDRVVQRIEAKLLDKDKEDYEDDEGDEGGEDQEDRQSKANAKRHKRSKRSKYSVHPDPTHMLQEKEGESEDSDGYDGADRDSREPEMEMETEMCLDADTGVVVVDRLELTLEQSRLKKLKKKETSTAATSAVTATSTVAATTDGGDFIVEAHRLLANIQDLNSVSACVIERVFTWVNSRAGNNNNSRSSSSSDSKGGKDGEGAADIGEVFHTRLVELFWKRVDVMAKSIGDSTSDNHSIKSMALPTWVGHTLTPTASNSNNNSNVRDRDSGSNSDKQQSKHGWGTLLHVISISVGGKHSRVHFLVSTALHQVEALLLKIDRNEARGVKNSSRQYQAILLRVEVVSFFCSHYQCSNNILHNLSAPPPSAPSAPPVAATETLTEKSSSRSKRADSDFVFLAVQTLARLARHRPLRIIEDDEDDEEDEEEEERIATLLEELYNKRQEQSLDRQDSNEDGQDEVETRDQLCVVALCAMGYILVHNVEAVRSESSSYSSSSSASASASAGVSTSTYHSHNYPSHHNYRNALKLFISQNNRDLVVSFLRLQHPVVALLFAAHLLPSLAVLCDAELVEQCVPQVHPNPHREFKNICFFSGHRKLHKQQLGRLVRRWGDKGDNGDKGDKGDKGGGECQLGLRTYEGRSFLRARETVISSLELANPYNNLPSIFDDQEDDRDSWGIEYQRRQCLRLWKYKQGGTELLGLRDGMPLEVIRTIVSFLSHMSVTRFGVCSKHTFELCNENALWARIYKQRFPSKTFVGAKGQGKEGTVSDPAVAQSMYRNATNFIFVGTKGSCSFNRPQACWNCHHRLRALHTGLKNGQVRAFVDLLIELCHGYHIEGCH